MALAPLTTLATADTIGSFQALPVGFMGRTIIQMTLQEASEEFSPLLLKELLHLTMLQLPRFIGAQLHDHVGKLLEGRREHFPVVDRRVCLGHEVASFLARWVGLNPYVLWRRLFGKASYLITS